MAGGQAKMDVSLQAVNKQGRTIDFYLSSTRNIQAAKRFLGKALKSWTPPVLSIPTKLLSATITEIKHPPQAAGY
jgi:transposase-like protein